MQQRSLGRSALKVSSIAYGGWRLAGSEQGPPVPTSEPGKRALRAAIDAGFTFMDFADIYGGGRCEAIFGELLRESPGLRDQLVIATKCGIRRPADSSPTAPYRYDFSPEYLFQSVEGSLRRMQIETIDLLMLHRPDVLMNPSEVAGVFAALRDAGKVREFGVSNFLPSQFTALQSACPFPLVVNQIEFSLLQLAPLADGTLDQALALGFTPMAWSPLARGALVQPEASEPANRVPLRGTLEQVAKEYGCTPGVLALAWILKHPAKVIPVIGTVNPARIADLALAAQLGISREDWYRLLEAARGSRLP